MATVTISSYECVRDLLPPVCAACGRPAADRVAVTYSWNPGGKTRRVLYALSCMTRCMKVHLPLCPQHAQSWRRRTVAIVLSSVSLLALLVAGAVWDALHSPPHNIGAFLWVVIWALFFVWLAAMNRPVPIEVRATEITDRHLTLEEVHTNFAAALAGDRGRSNDPLRARGYGDSRDDFDDQPHLGV